MSAATSTIRRIAVVGAPGAGKSTFATRLAQRLDCPVVHLDQLYWEPGWVIAEPQDFRARVEQAASGERWVMDGTYSMTFEQRIPKADRIYWFDRSRISCIWRVLKRITGSYGRVRPDMADGCPERLDWEFIKYIWRFNTTRRPRIVAVLEAYGAGDRTVMIRSDRDAQRALDQFQ